MKFYSKVLVSEKYHAIVFCYFPPQCRNNSRQNLSYGENIALVVLGCKLCLQNRKKLTLFYVLLSSSNLIIFHFTKF